MALHKGHTHKLKVVVLNKSRKQRKGLRHPKKPHPLKLVIVQVYMDCTSILESKVTWVLVSPATGVPKLYL